MTGTQAPTVSNVDLALAAAHSLLPLAGDKGAIADQLLTAGLAFWADFQSRKAQGLLTMDDLEAAATKTTIDLAVFKAAVDALPA